MTLTAHDPDEKRREVLVATTTIVGAAALGATAVPFIASMGPSERARAAGGPARIDISRSPLPGQQVTVAWRGKPVWLLRRTPQMVERLQQNEFLDLLVDPQSRVPSQQPAYAQNALRSIKPDLLVTIALCTHLGCIPTFRPEVGAAGDALWPGGYFCPCHGSKFDLAGRVFKHVPAPTNLVIPPHRYVGSDAIEIGIDQSTT